MKKKKLAFIASALIASAVLSCATVSASAINVNEVRTVYNINTSSYRDVDVRVGSAQLKVPAKMINSTTYVSVKYFCEALSYCKVSFDSKTRTATVSSDNMYITARANEHYICANGRYLWTDTALVILDDGRIYAPVRLLARAYGVQVNWHAESSSVTVTGAVVPIMSGDRFYDSDKVYWLSRIISAESRGEPLLGQIAVGNVVLNRVKSWEFPNTIYGVIFDTRYGVQFTPVSNGTIYQQPYYLSVIAAKICLEGETVSDRVLYFLEPEISTSFWIVKNRQHAFDIGSHDFYY
jgi:N-acetylmuramoyl-L-alanine amidase